MQVVGVRFEQGAYVLTALVVRKVEIHYLLAHLSSALALDTLLVRSGTLGWSWRRALAPRNRCVRIFRTILTNNKIGSAGTAAGCAPVIMQDCSCGRACRGLLAQHVRGRRTMRMILDVGKKIHNHFEGLCFSRSAFPREEHTLVLALVLKRLVGQVCKSIAVDRKNIGEFILKILKD